LNRYNFRNDCWRAYGQEDWIERVFLGAWSVLERYGLLTRTSEDWYIVSEEGQAAANGSFETFRVALMLPKELLHSRLLPDVWKAFARGDYPDAVFKAFREVELFVREAGRYAAREIGVPLMHRAFNPETGPLTDPVTEAGERSALRDLFAGAIGSYK